MFGVVKHILPETTLNNLQLTKKDGFIFSKKEKYHTRVYGIECEIMFDISPKKARSVTRFLRNSYNWGGRDFVDILNYFVFTLQETQKFLMKVEIDAGNLEFVTYPSSLNSLKIQVREISIIISRLMDMGFNPNHYLSGFHVNINRFSLGKEVEEQKETFKKMLYFLYLNWEFTNSISRRLNSAQRRSDLLFLMGDLVGDLTSEEKAISFYKKTESLIRALGTHDYHQFLGFSVNKTNVDVIECTIFASSNRESVMLTYIEFIDCLITFCYEKDIKSLTISQFNEYVIEKQAKYINLYLTINPG